MKETTVQPEATGAVMEVTKWLKPSGTRLLARPCRGGHPRPPNFMHFPRRNAPRTVHEPLDSHGSRCSAMDTHVQWPCLVPGLLPFDTHTAPKNLR